MHSVTRGSVDVSQGGPIYDFTSVASMLLNRMVNYVPFFTITHLISSRGGEPLTGRPLRRLRSSYPRLTYIPRHVVRRIVRILTVLRPSGLDGDQWTFTEGFTGWARVGMLRTLRTAGVTRRITMDYAMLVRGAGNLANGAESGRNSCPLAALLPSLCFPYDSWEKVGLGGP